MKCGAYGFVDNGAVLQLLLDKYMYMYNVTKYNTDYLKGVQLRNNTILDFQQVTSKGPKIHYFFDISEKMGLGEMTTHY